MRGRVIVLAGLLLTAACKPATGDVATDVWPGPEAVTPVADGGPATPGPPEVFPVLEGTTCDIRGGWSEDLDPAGLNVRAGPSPTAAVVGKLPRSKFIKDEDRMVPTTFDIVEVRDGWVRIENVIAPEHYFGDASRTPRLPSGWISGHYVGFDLQSEKAFAEPDPRSPMVASSWETPSGVDHPLAYRNLLECRGKWVKMVFTDYLAREREGWARGVCSNVETTCDGDSGDDFKPGEKKPYGPDARRAPSIWDTP